MKTVILTGGMGSGKSAVSACLKARGVPVYDSDSRTKSLYDRDPALVDRMEVLLGTGLRDAEGRLDRRKLAGLIFADPQKKAAVEALVHPAVLADFRRWKRWHRPKGWSYGLVPFVVLESAIILSCPVFDGVEDKVVLVDADEAVRAARSAARDGSDLESALRRIRQQSFDMSRVDAVLRNDGTLEALPAKVDRVFLNLFLSL
ncbi:MAG: dephospho-CoA kinase [Bacteroidales bacterium]|nr:dephospho-CoA kinase [Bacteroidales bacterium]